MEKVLNYPDIISEQDRTTIVTDYKGYFTKWDMDFLTRVFNLGIQNEREAGLFETVVIALEKRKAENNVVTHLTDTQIDFLSNAYSKFNIEEKKWFDQIQNSQFFSVTKKQHWIIDKLVAKAKQPELVNYFN